MNPFRFVAVALACASTLHSHGAVSVQEMNGRVRVEVDGKLLTEYCFSGAPHVYFFPLVGPGGLEMTRSWPMRDVPGEEQDHPHQRSLWFAHGAVNGVNFWAEPASFPAGKAEPTGEIRHVRFRELQGGETEGVIRDDLNWVAPDGSIPLTAVQTFRAYERPASERLFDFEVVLTAGAKDVVFGDTKEGSMALRIAESMRLRRGQNRPGEGHLVSSEGGKDDAVWGKRAAWVDYSGPVNGKVVGIGFFDHPANPRHPTRWHARDYGLFAANPFCEHEMDKSQPPGAGDFTIAAGRSVTFRYRFLLHEGDAASAGIAARYAEYARPAP